jgi:hypothetical protein
MQESVMFRRFIIAIATVAALGISLGATDVFAAGHRGGGGHGGGGHGGGWHGGYGGGWHGGYGGRGGWGGGWVVPGLWGWGWGYYPYGYGPYYPDCYRMIRVRTPYGPRWRRVWVCD